MLSLAIGAMPGGSGGAGSGGGTERGPDTGASDAGGLDAGAIDALGPTGGMLGAETRGAAGGGALCGILGAIGAFGARGAFAECGRKSDGATRTAGSAASALPDGVFPDRCPASFAIRKF